MLMLVRAHPDGEHETVYESRWTEPEVPVHEYVDGFENRCWRFTAPVGRFRIRYDALVSSSGDPDPVVPDAPLVPVEDLPDSTLVVTLPSRYIQSDLLIQKAWDLFGSTPHLAAGASRVRLGAHHDSLRNRQQRSDGDCHGRARTARRRLSGLCAAGNGVVPRAEHPCTLHLRLLA
jgi:hypothetical protein